jgi:hypothetical protein
MPVKEMLVIFVALAVGYYLGQSGLISRFIPGS